MTIFLLFILFFSALVIAEEDPPEEDSDAKKTLDELKSGLVDASKKTNLWNETKIISPVWQKLIGGFFGLNLHKKSTEISVREAIVFFMVFIMFIVIILDILKLTPLFKEKLFGIIPTNFIASLVITILVSITGSFINLKNLFVKGIEYTISSLDWEWLNFANQNSFGGIILTMFVIIPIIILIHEALDWLNPLIKKYSQVSRAEAKGRQLGSAIQSTED